MKKSLKKILVIIEVYLPHIPLLTTASLLLIAIVAGNIHNIRTITTETHLFIFLLLNFILSTSVIILLNLLHKENTFKYLGFNHINREDILLGALLSIIFMIVFLIFDNFIGKLIDIDLNSNINNLGIMIKRSTNIYAYSIITSLIVAFHEEILRVFVLERVKNNFSKVFLLFFIFVYSLYFGMSHLSWGLGNVVSAVIFSILLMLIYLWRKNIYILIMIHFFTDTSALILLAIISKL